MNFFSNLLRPFASSKTKVPDHTGATGPANVNSYHDNCGRLYPDINDPASDVLTLREACNKIIHATEFEHSYQVNNHMDDYSLDSKMLLHGHRNGKQWRAELDIILFADCLFYNFKLE